MDINMNGSDSFSTLDDSGEISFALKMTRFVADRILIPIIVTLGITGNCCNIAVFSRPKMRTSTNIYLTNLAIFDTLYLIFMLTLSLMPCRDKHQDATNYYYFPYGRALSDLFGNCSVWVTVCFTLERYIGVCHPMRGKAICTVQRAKLITFAVFILCLANTLPSFFEMEVYEQRIEIVSDTMDPAIRSSNKTPNVINDQSLTTDGFIQQARINYTEVYYECVQSEFGKRESYKFGYYWWYIIIFTFVPLILLSVFNMFLIKSVWNANSRRKLLSQSHVIGDHSNQSIEQQRVTTMLISVVIIFLLCQFPWAILLVYKIYLSTFSVEHVKNNLLIAGNVCNILGQVNASMNFILYSYFSSRFRRTFKRLICRWNNKNMTTTNILIANFQSRKSDFTKDSITKSMAGYHSQKNGRKESSYWRPSFSHHCR